MKREIEDAYPLSPMQQGMLFHSLYAAQTGVDIVQMTCDLHEDLNIPALNGAWRRVIDRHSILRTSFRWQDLNKPLQEVHRTVKCPFHVDDWRDLSSEERVDKLQVFLQAD